MASQDIQQGKIATGNHQLTRERAVDMSSMEVFCCYAREDRQLLKDLMTHLMPLRRQGLVTIWADTDINAGSEWEEEIEKHLNTSQVILLLVSPDFMASEYCYSKEMQRAMERHDRGEARVIPIILHAVLWREAPFGKLQALPEDAKPVIDWPNLDDAFFDVAEGIHKAVEELMTSLEASPENKRRQEIVPSQTALQTSIQDIPPEQDDLVRIPQSWRAGKTVRPDVTDNLATSSPVRASPRDKAYGTRIANFIGGIFLSIVGFYMLQLASEVQGLPPLGVPEAFLALWRIVCIAFIALGILSALAALFGFSLRDGK